MLNLWVVKKQRAMITIRGGVISHQNGTTVSYKAKCDKCGTVDSDESIINVTRGVTEVYSKRCSACGNNQTIMMKHVVEPKPQGLS